jgi:small nuclear ribonucleoprotein (snRNP)-like protein
MRDWVRHAWREKVVVHTKDNRSIRGVLIEASKRELVLREAEYLQEGIPAKLEGEVGVPRSNVAFIQKLTGTGPE